jgi:hypothetical protein
MAENRHLLKVNETLASQVESLTNTLARFESASLGFGGNTSIPAPPM